MGENRVLNTERYSSLDVRRFLTIFLVIVFDIIWQDRSHVPLDSLDSYHETTTGTDLTLSSYTKMALQPALHPQVIIGPYDAPHTLDIFCANLGIIILKDRSG